MPRPGRSKAPAAPAPPAPLTIDLNADVGESYGAWSMGDDAALLPLVTSANVACGAHAGDPVVMARTVALARRLGVAVGAHPGYPDRDGFGRRDLPMTAEELRASILAQLGALDAIARAAGVRLAHVKPHGALYNRAARDPELAGIVASAVRSVAPGLALVGLAGSALLTAGVAEGLPVIAEAFADRVYEADGSLRSRRFPDSMHHDPAAAAAQARSIVLDGRVRAHDGSWVPVTAASLCVHGDTPGAAAIAAAVRATLIEAGVRIAAPGAPA
jgi:UPF0271 protein